MSNTPRTDKLRKIIAGADSAETEEILVSHEQLERELTESLARESQLREALDAIRRRMPIMGSTGDYRDGQLDALNAISEQVSQAISLHPPPVVSMADAQALFHHAESILDLMDRCGIDETPSDFSETYKAAQTEFINFKSKYPTTPPAATASHTPRTVKSTGAKVARPACVALHQDRRSTP
jgi:hypothetical protein